MKTKEAESVCDKYNDQANGYHVTYYRGGDYGGKMSNELLFKIRLNGEVILEDLTAQQVHQYFSPVS